MKYRCPICRKPTDSEASPDFPFCSERCRLLDLGNWSSEKYRISETMIDESTPEIQNAMPISTMTEHSASAIANRAEEADPVTPRKPRIALFIATACGLGYLPLAPGTWGSLGGLITAMLPGWILYASVAYHWGFVGELSVNSLPVDPIFAEQCILALLIALIGVWSASRVAWYLQRKDPGRVVIDEVSGQHLTLLLGCGLPIPSSSGTIALPSHAMGLITSHSVLNWKYWLVGFILFRVLDVWKPFPARQAESLPGGWGIMADDWVAGVYAGVALYLARFAGL